jgi:hypothetical protein
VRVAWRRQRALRLLAPVLERYRSRAPDRCSTHDVHVEVRCVPVTALADDVAVAEPSATVRARGGGARASSRIAAA